MSRAVLHITNEATRQKAMGWLVASDYGFTVEFKRPKRSIPQNDRMWAMLTDISEQVKWHGVRLAPKDWKLIFMDALNREMRIVPNLDGTGFVNIGNSTSNLTKSEHSDLTMLMEKFAAERGVELGGPEDAT